MAKVYMQSIPSDLYAEYRQGLRPAVESTTGYTYFVAEYGYAGLVGARENWEVGPRKGLFYPKISVGQERARCNFMKGVDIFHEQPKTGGVLPPDPGPRGKDWWFAHKSPEECCYQDDFMKKTLDYIYRHAYPAWAIEPFVYFCQEFNERVEKFNINTMQLEYWSHGGPGTEQKMKRPYRCCRYKDYLVVVDFYKDVIFMLDAVNLDFYRMNYFYNVPWGTHTESFDTPIDVVADDKYIYVLEDGKDRLLVLEWVPKTDLVPAHWQWVDYISLVAPGDDTYPGVDSLALDYRCLYAGDIMNAKIKRYSRSGRYLLDSYDGEDIGEKGYLYASSMVSDGDFLYVGNMYMFRTYKIPADFEAGAIKDDELVTVPQGHAMCGDLVIINDLAKDKFICIKRDDYTEHKWGGEPDGELGQWNQCFGACGPQQVYWKDC